MGQHKYNPNCELLRNGALPAKHKSKSKREAEQTLKNELNKRLGVDKLYRALGVRPEY